jgi:hypothetical protein
VSCVPYNLEIAPGLPDTELTRSVSCSHDTLIIPGYTISDLVKLDDGSIFKPCVSIPCEPGSTDEINCSTVFTIVTPQRELVSTDIPLTAASLKDSYWTHWSEYGFVIVYKEAEPKPVLDPMDDLPKRSISCEGAHDPMKTAFLSVNWIEVSPDEREILISGVNLELKYDETKELHQLKVLPILKFEPTGRFYYRITSDEFNESKFVMKSLNYDADIGYFIEIVLA